MLFSVVVPTCDRPDDLRTCLRRLHAGRQSWPEADYEVIVSDDGRSRDGLQQLQLEFPWVRWIQGPRRGPAANRNAGAAAAAGRWFVFTDDDCVPDRDWLAAYASGIERCPAAGAFEGAVLPQSPVTRSSARCPVNDSGGRFWSANVAVRRDIFDQVSGFSPLFPYSGSEDQDLYFRLQRITEIPFLAQARVEHPVLHPSLLSLISRVRPMVYSYTLLCLRHPDRFDGGSLVRRTLAGWMFHLRVIVRAIRQLDWRAVAVSCWYLSWGVIWTCRYHFSVRKLIRSAPAAQA